ncbi:hypothetical protein E4U43_001697 [Claviceps pusilla]|uniref:Uncharacterized protein n=1 Tax=Claviceps pusilla TaxID=123648 RepID=A0A9P7N838_9HYPO|nr:hypothetical protein E4U43_001697 [Claviceps pusilla]
MATKRLLSAPTTPSWPSSNVVPSSSDTTLVGASSPVLRSQTLPPVRPDFFNQAEKLARMTLELKVHKLVGQINSLAADVVQLKTMTKDNDAFCRQHAGRMEKVCHETEAARALAESCMQLRDGDKVDVQDYVRRQVRPVVKEVYGMKSVVEELRGKMALVPTLAEANAVLAAVRVQREACEVARGDVSGECQLGLFALDDMGGGWGQEREEKMEQNCSHADFGGVTPGCARSKNQRARIEETIRSTRRWHMDHKTTTLTDAEFIAKYLRKQSRRDPGMAVYLQRAIWKRVKARDTAQDVTNTGPSRRPQSLEEFCKHVTWDDVKRAVEDVLVRRVYGPAAESLSQMQMEQ